MTRYPATGNADEDRLCNQSQARNEDSQSLIESREYGNSEALSLVYITVSDASACIVDHGFTVQIAEYQDKFTQGLGRFLGREFAHPKTC